MYCDVYPPVTVNSFDPKYPKKKKNEKESA